MRPGEELDWAALEAHLRANLPELAGEFMTLQFPNGSANLTYLLRFGDTELVLRRPPFGVVAPGAHDMKREYRVLSKLWRIFDRAPRAYLFCDDHVGDRLRLRRHGAPSSARSSATTSRRRWPATTTSAGGSRSPSSTRWPTCTCSTRPPLIWTTLGRPDGFVERQVTGWQTRWELVRPDDGPPEMDTVAGRLLASMPAPTRVSFVHNDLKLDNCQFDPADPDRVQSIFDWDMTTLGEPLIDLGTLLNYWPDPSDPPNAGRVSHQGLLEMRLPTRAEITARYAERTGIETSDATWYESFAQWKTGVVVQQLHRRWERGESTDPRMEFVADRLPLLAATASRLLDQVG